MRTAHAALFALLSVLLAACQARTDAVGCGIDGPEPLLPERVRQVRLGMSLIELEGLLGQADYSPVEGLFYFSTGGDCPLDDADRFAPCGVVADFRDQGRGDPVPTASLQACRWGAIGE